MRKLARPLGATLTAMVACAACASFGGEGITNPAGEGGAIDPSKTDGSSLDAGPIADSDVADSRFGLDPDAVGTRTGIVFVTTGLTKGNMRFGSVVGAIGRDSADDRCNAEAAGANIQFRSFVAWLSTTGSNAVDRLPNDMRWTRPSGGQEVFPSRAAILSGKSPEAAINTTASGAPIDITASAAVWTGTGVNGTAGATRCSDWMTEGGAAQAGYGQIGALGTSWTAAQDNTCDADLHIICFEK